MCIRRDNRTSEFLAAEVAVIMLPEIWTVLMSRHGACNPSEACVIDACLRTTASDPVTPEEIDANYAKDLSKDLSKDLAEDECTHWKFPGAECRHDKASSFHEPLNPELRDKIFEKYTPGPDAAHVHNFDRLHGFCRCGHLRSTAE